MGVYNRPHTPMNSNTLIVCMGESSICATLISQRAGASPFIGTVGRQIVVDRSGQARLA